MKTGILPAILFFAVMALMLTGESRAGDDKGEHAPPAHTQGYYAGLGVSIENCVTCHDVGPYGPRYFSSQAPSFERIADKFSSGDEKVDFETMRDVLFDIAHGRTRHEGMPSIHLEDNEILWMAEYIATLSTRR